MLEKGRERKKKEERKKVARTFYPHRDKEFIFSEDVHMHRVSC